MSKKVLTIDDSKTLRMIVGKHLAPFGVQVFQAENGEQGIVRARETSPDVILLDYNMPLMDGYQTLVELKADPSLNTIPVVMLTTETVKDTVVRLAKLGLKDYIAKPFTREILLAKLNPILNLFDGDQGLPEPGTVAIPQAAAGSDKITLLAIDDKANVLDLLKEYLGEEFRFITAASGRAAMHAIAHQKFDYMFLDLSMPDMSPFEVLEYYLKNSGNNASIKNIVAMALRTAKQDIGQAMSAGVRLILHKPFTREEALKIVNQLPPRQYALAGPGVRFLALQGKVRVLECPPGNDARFRSVAGALTSAVVKEIDEMAEEGLDQLVIIVGEGFLADMTVTRKFLNMLEHTLRLSLNVRLVAESKQAREALHQFAETAKMPTDASLELALSALQ
jgi:two-component system, cell cycle response regulator